MPAQREPQASTPKKKKKVSVPGTTSINAIEGGQGVKASHEAATASPKQVTKTYAPTAPTPSVNAITGGKGVKKSKKAAKASNKQLKKKYPDILSHKEIREAKAFTGDKVPTTKGEKRAAAKGEAVRNILYGKNADDHEDKKIMPYLHVPTQQIRAGTINSLHDQKDQLQKQLKGIQNDDNTHSVAIKSAKFRNVNAQLKKTKLNITRLEKQTLHRAKQDFHKNLEKLHALKGKDGVDKKQLHQAIKAQEKGLRQLTRREVELGNRKQKQQAESVKAFKLFKHKGTEAIENLDTGDPQLLSELGFRQKGHYENSKLKYPGIPGWTDFNAPKPSSALEDAIEPASFFFPIGLAGEATRLAGVELKLASTALRGSKAVRLGFDQVLTTPARFAAKSAADLLNKSRAYNLVKAGGKGTAAFLDKYASPYTIALAHASDLAHASKLAPTLREMGVVEAQTVKAADKTVIERMGVDKSVINEITGKTQMELAARAIDEGITSSVKKMALGVPHTFTDAQLLGIKAGALGAKGAAVGGGAIAVPILLDKDSDAAKNIMRDAYDLVVGVVPTTYEMLAGTAEAVRGIIPGLDDSDNSRLDHIWDLAKDHDPIVLAAQGRWDEALHAWEDRPISTLLELGGAEYAIGRTAGATMRFSPTKILKGTTGTGKASLARELQLGVGDTKAVLERYYSPDVLRKFGQVATDKVKPQWVKDAEVQSERLKRVDEEHGVFRNETARTWNTVMDDMAKMVRESEKVHPDAPNALPFIVSRIARSRKTALHDLINYRDDLAKMSFDEFRGQTINILDHLIAAPKALDSATLWGMAEKYIAEEAKHQKALQEISSLTETQSEWAKWIPYLVRHHKGKFIERNDHVVFQLDEQVRLSNGKLSKKYLDTTKPNDLAIVQDLAKQNGVQGEPGFFSMRSLDESLFTDPKTVKGNAPKFHHRSGEAIKYGTFDPTFNSLVAHRMGLRQSVVDADHIQNMVDLMSPYRVDAETGEVLLHGATSRENAAAIAKEGFNTDVVWLTSDKQTAMKYADWDKPEKSMVQARVDPKNPIIIKDGELPRIKDLSLLKDFAFGKEIHPSEATSIVTEIGRYGEKGREAARDAGYDAIIQINKNGDKIVTALDKSIIKKVYKGDEEIAPNSPESFYMDKKSAIEKRLKKDGLHKTHTAFNLEVARSSVAAHRGFGDKADAGFSGGTSKANLEAMKDGVKSKSDKATWVAVPNDVLKRLEDHANVESTFLNGMMGRGIVRLTREFKGGVLPFNPRWQFGNLFDMTSRAMMDQTGPKSYITGKRFLRKLKATDINAYHELMDRLGSGYMSEAFARAYEDIGLQPSISARGGHESGAVYQLELNTLRSIMRQPKDHVQGMNRNLAIARGLTTYVARRGLTGYRGLQEIGFGFGRGIERQFRTAQLGREASRYVRNIENSWAKSMLITPKAIEDTVMRIASDSNAQAALGRQVNSIMGDYTRLSPELRRATMSYAPFALWWRASATWVLTLPAKSPIKTAFLAAANRLTEYDRRMIGLSKYSTQEAGEASGKAGTQAADTKPAFMQGSIPLGDSLFPTKTLTSFGTFNDLGGDWTDFLIPQISSSLMVGKGVYWTGEELVYPDGSTPTGLEKVGIGLSNLLETYFPAARWWKMYKAEGAPDETATIWNPKPSGLRDTYIGQFPGQSRYEAPEENWFQNVFSPFRQFSTEHKPGIEISPPPFGAAAEASGADARKKTLADGKPVDYFSDGTDTPDWVKPNADTVKKPKKPDWVK